MGQLSSSERSRMSDKHKEVNYRINLSWTLSYPQSLSMGEEEEEEENVASYLGESSKNFWNPLSSSASPNTDPSSNSVNQRRHAKESWGNTGFSHCTSTWAKPGNLRSMGCGEETERNKLCSCPHKPLHYGALHRKHFQAGKIPLGKNSQKQARKKPYPRKEASEARAERSSEKCLSLRELRDIFQSDVPVWIVVWGTLRKIKVRPTEELLYIRLIRTCKSSHGVLDCGGPGNNSVRFCIQSLPHRAPAHSGLQKSNMIGSHCFWKKTQPSKTLMMVTLASHSSSTALLRPSECDQFLRFSDIKGQKGKHCMFSLTYGS